MLIPVIAFNCFIGCVRLHHEHIQFAGGSRGGEVSSLFGFRCYIEVFVDIRNVVGVFTAVVLLNRAFFDLHEFALNLKYLLIVASYLIAMVAP